MNPNIPQKQTGDQLTASEFNASLNAFPTKLNIPYGNIGMRIFQGRLAQNIANGSSTTYQITTVMNQAFDSVRLIFANNNKNFTFQVNTIGATVAGSLTDLNNSSAVWKTGNGLNLQQAQAGSTTDCVYTVSDWINIQSIPRTDSGNGYIVTLRAVMQADSNNIPCYGINDGGANIDDFTNWVTPPSPLNPWCSRAQTGDFVTTPAGFTSTTNLSYSPIVGLQYSAKGKVWNDVVGGDSIYDGRGTYKGANFVYLAAQSATTAQFAHEVSNLGWAGQTPLDYTRRIFNLLENEELRPNLVVMPSGSPNVASPLTATIISDSAGLRGQIIAKCSQLRIEMLICTWLPVNFAVKAWGTSDQLRIADNTAIISIASGQKYLQVCDLSTLFSNGVDGSGQQTMVPAYTDDGIHPNDAGNAAAAVLIGNSLKLITGQ